VLPAEWYDALQEPLQSEDLVPLETVGLTDQRSTGAAIDDALADLARRDWFQALVDVQSARESGVTPLPFQGAIR
jgi:hypothetical protein